MKLMKPAVTALAIAFTFCTMVISADPVETLPGYVSLAPKSFGLENKAPDVEVNLTAPLIRLAVAAAAGAAESQGTANPEAAQMKELLDNIEFHLVQVRVYESESISTETINKGQMVIKDLTTKGWQPIVHVPEENVDILLNSDGELIHGGFISVMQGDQIVLVNIVADIDPEKDGKLIGQVIGKMSNGQFDPSKIAQMFGGPPPPMVEQEETTTISSDGTQTDGSSAESVK